MNKRFSKIIQRNWPPKIISVTIAVLLFLFYRATSLEERFFSVPLNIVKNESYAIASEIPKSVKVSLRGTEEKIFTILEDDITVYADFTGESSEGNFRTTLKYTKKGTALNIEELEIRLEPSQISIELERNISKSVKIKPKLEGYPAKGFELDQYILSTEEILIEGPKSHVEGIEFIDTKPIDIDGKKEDFYVRTHLEANDPYLVFPIGDTVGFQGVITETVILKSMDDIGLVFMDLASNLLIKNELPKGSMKVQGKQVLLEKTSSEDFSFFVDCSQITSTGIYERDVSPIVPAGIVILHYSPENVKLEIVEKKE